MERERRLEEWDKRYLWHPFTQMKDYEAQEPLIVERAEGVYLVDINGRRYIDGVSSLWVNVHGHRHPSIDRAVREQLERVAHSTLLGLSNPPAIELAKRLVEIAPEGLTRVFYSDNGATAVEVALKMALQYWQHKGERQRTRFISFENAYHGDTLGAVSVGGIDLFHRIFSPLLFPTYRVKAPYCYRCPEGLQYPGCGLACLRALEETLKRHHRECAALIIEPVVQGAAGMIVHPAGFLRRVRELCTEYGVLMIADEVATGFGRTGRMFACEHEGVTPDLMCVAKGITGGYLPLAATLTTEEIYEAFLGEYHEFKTFFHGHTYTGNPLACAAACANLEVFEKERTLERMATKVELLAERLKEFWSLPHVGDVRQKGFMVGVELVADRKTKEPFPPQMKVGQKVILEARRQGVVIRPLGDVIVLMPPLAIPEGELERLVEIVYHAIEKVTATI